MSRSAKAIGLSLLALALLLFVGGLIGDRWLESAGGRRLLERELSHAIGYPVHLSGSYRFRLFPRIQIAGNDLSIGPGGEAAPVVISGFRAVVGLLPLLRQTLRIDSVALTGGRVDLAGLASLGRDAAADAGPVTIPAVAALELRDFRLQPPGEPEPVWLKRFQLTGFRPGEPTTLAIEAEQLRNGQPAVTVSASGTLLLASDLSVAEIVLDPLAIRTGSGQPQELTGFIRWEAADGRLAAELSHQAIIGELSATLEMTWREPLSGNVSMRLVKREDGSAALAALDFAMGEGALELAAIRAEVDGQSLSGRGCVISGTPLTVGLSLHAGELDLDRLAAWLPRGPGGTGPADLPLDVAIVMTVDRASLSGATAEGIRIVAGREPDCPPG